MSGIQCLSASLCHALDNQGDFLTFNGTDWTSDFVNSDLYWGSLSCATASFCMAGDAFGNVWAFNGTSWSETSIDTHGTVSGGDQVFPDSLIAISCPTTSFCAAVDASGYAMTYDGTTWSSPREVAPSELDDLSCPTTTFCVAGDSTGDVVAYNGSAWTEQTIDTTTIHAVSCPSASYCVAGDNSGNVFTFNGSSWSSAVPLDAGNSISGIFCPTASFCAAADLSGNVFYYGASAASSPTFSLELNEGGTVYTVFFYGDQSDYDTLAAEDGSLDPNLPLLAAATYLENAVEPPQGATSEPIYAVQAYPGTGMTATFGQPSTVSAGLLSQLTQDALLWAYSYVNDILEGSPASVGKTFTTLYDNELSQEAGIVAGDAVDLLTVFGPLYETVGSLLGSGEETYVSDFVSLLEGIASGSSLLGQDFSNAAGITSCLTGAGIVGSPGFPAGAAILGFRQAGLSSGQLSTLASCIYNAAYGQPLPQAVTPTITGFLSNFGSQLTSSAIGSGASVLAEGANSFLTLYFNAGFSATSAADAATASMDAAADNAFDANFLPLALASAVVQTFIVPAVDQLQEEVNLQGGGNLFAGILASETASLDGPVIDGAGDEAAFEAEGALFSMMGQWAAADYSYQTTLLLPDTAQQAADQELAAGAESDAEYVFNYQQAAVALAAGLAGEQTATSSQPNGTASATAGGVTADAQGQGSIAVKSFGTTQPIPAAGLAAGAEFFDVGIVPPSSFSAVTITACGVSSAATLMWWNASAQAWQNVSPAQALQTGTPNAGCLTFTVTASTSPSISQLTGTYFAAGQMLIPTQTTITGVPAAPVFGRAVTLTASVAATSTATRTPTGTVTFTSGTVVLGSIPVTNGTARFTTSNFPPGPDKVTAVYSGDDYFGTSAASVSFTTGFWPATCISSAHRGSLIVTRDESVCLTAGATISGPVIVQPGGSLWIQDAVIKGSLEAMNPAALRVCGATLTGPLWVQDATAAVLIGGASEGCAGNTIKGPVTIVGNQGGVAVMGDAIFGPLTVSYNAGLGTPPADPVLVIAANKIAGSLSCRANAPAPENYGSSNQVTGPEYGQCRGL